MHSRKQILYRLLVLNFPIRVLFNVWRQQHSTGLIHLPEYRTGSLAIR